VNNTVLWYTTRGAGAVTLVLLSAVVVLGILSVLRVQSTSWPRFLTVGLHRNLALMTLVFLALHIVTAVVDPFTHLGWLAAIVPFSSYYRTLWLGLGTIAFELMLAIVVTSLVRGLIGQVAWRLVHWLSYASWPIAVVHGAGTGTDAWSGWLFAIQAICVVSVLAAVGYRLTTRPQDPLADARTSFQSAVDRREPR
jgi:sulfoxide reductase heme-binding subunit YedZ